MIPFFWVAEEVRVSRELPENDVETRLAEAMAPDGEGGRFEPRRHGFLLPLGVVVFVVSAILLLVFFLSTTSRDPFVAPDLQTRRFITTEWRLLEELQSDLQFQLSVKEAEIARFQQQIKDLNRRSTLLEDAIESSVAGRRDALAEERAAALDRRQRELAEEGLSGQEVDARLRELRLELEGVDRRRLETYRQDVESDFGAQIEEVFEEREVVRRNLLQAQNEREELLAELDRTRTALEAELEAAQAAFSEERALLVRDLRVLAEAKRQDEATLGIIRGLYGSAIEAINAGDFSEARLRLDDILSLEPTREPSDVDRALVGLLTEVVARREMIEEEGRAGLESAALRLLVARQLSRDGARALRAGDSVTAEAAYREAMELLPEALEASVALRRLEDERWRRDADAFLRAVSGDPDNPRPAPRDYKQVVALLSEPYESVLQEAVEGLEAIYLSRGEEEAADQVRRVARLTDRLRGLQSRLEEQSAALEAAQAEAINQDSLRRQIEATLGEQREIVADINRSIRELERRAPAITESRGELTPGTRLLALVAALETEAEGLGAETGRRELAEEIALLARYLRGDRLLDVNEAQARILAASDADPAFSAAAVDVQELGVEGLGRPELPLGQRRLLGFVASRDGNRVQVELLGSLEAQRGQRIFVSEVSGTVEAVLADRVLAFIDAGRAEDVRFRDLVYVEIRPQ